MPRRKILHLHASAALGGTEVSSFQLASRLNQTEFELGVLFHSQAGPLVDSYHQAGIACWTVPFPRLLPALRVLRQFQPDIIQIYGLKTNILWRPLLWAMGYRRMIGVIQGLTNQGERPGLWRLFCDRVTLGFLRYYVANSESIRTTLVQKRFKASKLKVIHNGILLTEPLSPSANRNDPPVILCLGNLRAVKGHAYLLESLKILQNRGVAFEAWIVGDGPLRETLISQAESLGLKPLVRFLGRVENVESVLRQADIFVSLSLSEGVPVAMMEAMAQKLPVVATRAGGVGELIEHGKEGFLVPPRNARDAADNLEQLLADSDLRKTLGEAGRSKVERFFNLDQTVQAYELMYREVCTNG